MNTAMATVTQSGSNLKEDEFELRRGPWTLEEDSLLAHYVACHGEGRWNMVAKCSGLKRSGKSCRLRWLNYLKPDIKRGNLTLQEQLLILELHSKWGNRWSKIAQHLPGRTDNEIKNYWRTRVQKQARQLKIESNSKKFLDAIRCFWMPRLVEKMEQTSTPSPSPSPSSSTTTSTFSAHETTKNRIISSVQPNQNQPAYSSPQQQTKVLADTSNHHPYENPSSKTWEHTAYGDDDHTFLYDDCGYGYFGNFDLEVGNLPAMSAYCQMAEENDWTSDDMAVALWNLD